MNTTLTPPAATKTFTGAIQTVKTLGSKVRLTIGGHTGTLPHANYERFLEGCKVKHGKVLANPRIRSKTLVTVEICGGSIASIDLKGAV